MAMPSSGTITFAQLQTEFGGSNPIGINEYYRGGGLVPDIAANAGVPTSGAISLSNFYNAVNRTFSLADLTDIYGQNFFVEANAYLDIDSDGDVIVTTDDGGAVDVGGWTSPITGGIGSGYEVQLVKNSGTSPASGPALNTWHSLSTPRTWGMYAALNTTVTGNFTLNIRITSGATVATKTFDFTAASSS
jgi:hypothetical protein